MLLEVLRKRKNEILAIARHYGAYDLQVFGSVARGEDNDESDIDLLVVVESSDEPKRYKRSFVGYRALVGLRVANDVVVYTKAEFETISQDLNSLACKVKNNGKRIYVRS